MIDCYDFTTINVYLHFEMILINDRLMPEYEPLERV